MRPGLDRELDEMKDRYDGLDSLLREVAMDIASKIPEDLDIDVNVIYFPQLGFNIAIPLTRTGDAAYTGSDEEEWMLIFVTENRAYFKDFRMREMDERLGDIYGLVCGKHVVYPLLFRTLILLFLPTEREIDIVHELAQRILQYEDVLVEASDVYGEIDR